MDPLFNDILASYNDHAPLEHAHTIPASWYTHDGVASFEREHVFARTWQAVARVDHVASAGQFVTTELAGEPLLIVRSSDGQLRAFYNVCRHHAAAIATEERGQ